MPAGVESQRARMYNIGMENSIYISKTGEGHMNLAVDEYILGKYHDGEMRGVTLYFYVNENAVIIGRNQNAWRECDIAAMERDGVQLVRRHTGGGAVYHDAGNLNFSFITDEKHYDKERQTGVIAAACRSLGIETELSGRNDLLAGGKKISGNAFAVWGRARGQHGTLLVNTDLTKLARYLTVSKEKLSAKGVASVRSRVCNLADIAPVTVDVVRAAVISSFIGEYGAASELAFTAKDEREIAALYEKQASWEWRLGMAPEFDVKLEHRFSFGELQLLMKLKRGAVVSAKVFTDALDTGIAQEIVSLVTGARFIKRELAERLMGGGETAREIAAYIESEGIYWKTSSSAVRPTSSDD